MAHIVELKLAGLTCDHCKAHVYEELEALDGVTAVEIDLVPHGVTTVVITAQSELSDESLHEAIDEAGAYTIEAISRR